MMTPTYLFKSVAKLVKTSSAEVSITIYKWLNEHIIHESNSSFYRLKYNVDRICLEPD